MTRWLAGMPFCAAALDVSYVLCVARREIIQVPVAAAPEDVEVEDMEVAPNVLSVGRPRRAMGLRQDG